MGIFFLILGLIFGSFLNVVLFRFGTGIGLGGRSRCASCGTTLKWYELIPVLSFVIQGGKSRYTKTKLSLQYPFVELLTGFLFFFSYKISISQFFFINSPEFIVEFLFLALVSCYLVLISVYDFKHTIIPHQFSNTLIAIAFSSLFINLNIPNWFLIPDMFVVLSPVYVAGPLFLLWLFSKGKWIGFADVKLAIALGWFLLPIFAVSSLIISFWIGAIVGVILLIVKKGSVNSKTEIPFGPFLLVGLCLVYYFNWSILDLGKIFLS